MVDDDEDDNDAFFSFFITLFVIAVLAVPRMVTKTSTKKKNRYGGIYNEVVAVNAIE